MSWDIQLKQVAVNLPGCEGPLVTTDGCIFIVEPDQGRICKVHDGQVIEFSHTRGIPAGLQLHQDGTFWVADVQRGILMVDSTGAVSPIATEWAGQPIRGCNDCSFNSQGNLYFTAPAGSSLENPCGEVFRLGRNGELRRIGGGFAFCNGIAVSANDRLLIVAETFTKKLWGYRLDDLSLPKFPFASVPGEHRGGPDGIDFDAKGNLLVANWGGGHLEAFSPVGELVERIALPFEKPSNLHFCGPNSREILVTEHTFHGLWKGEWRRPGQCQYGWQDSLPSN